MERKIQVKRSDLYFEAYIQLDCAANLLYTLEEEHFISANMPEDWGDDCNYQRLSRKIRAVSSVLSHAMDVLSVAENDGTDEYSNETIKLMADIIRQSEEQQSARESTKGGAVGMESKGIA